MLKTFSIVAILFSICLFISGMIFIGCGGDDDDSAEEATSTPTPGPSPTPTFNTATCTACHQVPPAAGSHNAHNGSFCCQCLECHYTSIDADYQYLEDHDNGTVDVVFQAGGTWDNTGCFGLTSGCHGDRLW